MVVAVIIADCVTPRVIEVDGTWSFEMNDCVVSAAIQAKLAGMEIVSYRPATITDINKRLDELRDAAGPDEDPCGSEEAQQLLKELRRLNRTELNKLSVVNRFRLMAGQPLLKDE